MDITDKAYLEAQKVVKNCSSQIGLKASALNSGYSQVWARDCIVTLLGSILLNDNHVNLALKNSLNTLGKYQSNSGCIPSNVIVNSKKTDFRAYMDGNCYFIIGQRIYFENQDDLEFLKSSWPKIIKTINFLESQDVYQTGLIAMQEAADWMDHLAVRGRSLGINGLYYQALLSASKLAIVLGEKKFQKECDSKAETLKGMIKKLFWVDIREIELKEDFLNEEFNILTGYKLALLRDRPYFLPYIGFREVGTWFDVLANLQIIIFGISNTIQTKKILDFIEAVGVNLPYGVKAIYPPIQPGDSDWRDYYFNKNLNLPNHYHNGGIWPYIGGFYIAALIKAGRKMQAKIELEKLALANRQGKEYEWEFNEWLHGITGKPMGMEYQAWSAGMYLYAYNCVKEDKVFHF